MSISRAQIRILAAFFTDAQLSELFGTTTKEIDAVFQHIARPCPRLQRLPRVVENAIRASDFLIKVDHGVNARLLNSEDESRVAEFVMPVNKLGLPKAEVRALNRAGIFYVWQLAVMEEEEILELPGCGLKTLDEVLHYFRDKGLLFAQPADSPLILEARFHTEAAF